MLVSRQQKIEVQLFRKPAGDFFSGVRQAGARLQILFKAAMIDTEPHITASLQAFAGRLCRRKRIRDPETLQIAGGFPDVYEIRDHAGDADP